MSEHGHHHSHHYDLSKRHYWQRVDETSDNNFYHDPRLVVHVDEHFIATLGLYFTEHLLPHATLLDLMSSYKTHLPADYKRGRVVGLGLNAVELQSNAQLDEYIIHDLNQHPTLPYPDATFDVVLNTVSIQYLIHPLEVFREVGRVLKPGGSHIVSFSNRMFPTKAVQIWRELSELERVVLVKQYFTEAGLFEPPEEFEEIDHQHHSGGFLALLYGSKDPVYIVSAKKLSRNG
ncbi:MAG: methyltransferase domain-containing protein [Chloroflexota bacterium]